ncbi:transcriptional regulator [Nocardia sp. BMG111209]|uniref:MmyB family transcriptional regulator n=1 Tax=Nocardia sp. BMG111209 TaxID=1160137 RepID=UPI001E3BAE7F|nr:transcriptional regulator [Nocardia sp. BMG111209]
MAHALRLNEIEHDHLLRLAWRPARSPRLGNSLRGQGVRPEVLGVLARFDDLPAIVVSRSLDVLAWTPMAAALLGLDSHGERNMARRVFLLPETRRLYPDWTTVATETVAHLRRTAAQQPTDPDLTRLIGELSVASPDFSRLWSRHQVSGGVVLRKRFDHPRAGSFELRAEVLTLPGDRQTLAFYDADPGTSGVDAPALLRDA